MADPSTSMLVGTPNLQDEERDTEIEKLIKITELIVAKLGHVKEAKIKADLIEGVIDIDLSDEISGVLRALFTCLRKEENDHAGFQKYKSYNAKVDGVDISIQSLVEEVNSRGIKINFLIATPIVELMTLFKAFFDEVRTGVTRFKVRASIARRSLKRDSSGRVVAASQDPKGLTQSISQYGLTNHHVPLLQGITLAPERRTEAIRSLGPLTQAIVLVLEDKDHSNISDALLNSLQMLPMAQEVINCLKYATSRGAVSGILKELGDILLITTARATQNIYLPTFFPLLMFIQLWHLKPVGFNWSFSGAGVLKLYTLAIEQGMRLRMRSGSDKFKTAEVVFHAMFGTYLKDLSILSQITTHVGKWHQRRELNSVFHKRASQGVIELTPIAFKYVSKMAQPLLTKSLGNVHPVATSRPSFSGFRRRTFSQEFLTYLTTGRAAHNYYSSDPVQLYFSMKKTKDALLEKKDWERLLTAGTKEWEEHKNGEWVTCNFVPVEGSIKFYGVA